jgi:hypothetical protein
MSFSWSPKDPDETYEYTHDWANRLLVDQGGGLGVDVGDTLVLPTDPDPAKRPTLAVQSGSAIPLGPVVSIPGTAKLQYFFPAGGQVGDEAVLVGTVWTTQGRKYQETFKLKLKAR